MAVLPRVFAILFVVLMSLPILLAALDDVTVIDFGRYEGRVKEELALINTDSNPHHSDGAPTFIIAPEVMFVSNWIVELRSSGAHIPNIIKSRCTLAESKEQKQSVMGVRINFPETRQNDRAYIRPQFPLHAYNKQGNFANLSNGIAANVGVIKDVSIWVKGRNYPFSLAVRFMDQENNPKEFFLGDLFFDNWRRLTWVNPNYAESIQDRVLERKPLYPKDIPYYRFDSFVIYRGMAQIGGDFVLYIKDITMSYDLHTPTVLEDDIDDEAVWKILQQRTLQYLEREHRMLGEKAHDFETQQRLMREKSAE